MSAAEAFLLTVISKSTAHGSRWSNARATFKRDISKSGGLWLSPPQTLDALHQSVRDGAPGAYSLFLAPEPEPVNGLLQRLRVIAGSHPTADVIYGDAVGGADTASGRSRSPRKPDWSPARLLHENYVGDTLLVRTSFLLSVAGEQMGTSTWDSWSFLLACVRQRARMHHDDSVWTEVTRGYDSTAASPAGRDDAARRVQHHLSLVGSRRTARPSPLSPVVEILPDLDAPLPSHAIVTLTAGAADPTIGKGAPFIFQHLEALSSACAAASQQVVVVGEECNALVRRDLESRRTRGFTLVDAGRVFNFARRSNYGRVHARAEFLIFTNDDFVPHHDDWVHHLLAPFEDQSVAITGATLQYEDGSLQHAGISVAAGNFVHSHHGLQVADAEWDEVVTIDREVDAVTGACLAIRSRVFDEVGGFFEGFPLNFNDVDLCLKARMCGHSVVLVAMPLGHHFESKTRPSTCLPEEFALMEMRWPSSERRAAYPFEPAPAAGALASR